MQRQANQRLGYGTQDSLVIKLHPFFKSVNWDDAAARRLEPPFKPSLVLTHAFKNFSSGR